MADRWLMATKHRRAHLFRRTIGPTTGLRAEYRSLCGRARTSGYGFLNPRTYRVPDDQCAACLQVAPSTLGDT